MSKIAHSFSDTNISRSKLWIRNTMASYLYVRGVSFIALQMETIVLLGDCVAVNSFFFFALRVICAAKQKLYIYICGMRT